MAQYDVILIRNANLTYLGGAEKYQILLAKELLTNNITALIATAHQPTLALAEENQLPHQKTPWLIWQNFQGWRIIFTPTYLIWQLILTIRYYFLFKKYQPKIVHLQSRDDFIAGTLAAKLLKIRVVWTDHADLKHLFTNLYHPLKNPIGKIILKLSQHSNYIILVAKSEKTAIEPLVKRDHPFWQKVKIIHNGILHQSYPHQPQAKFTFGILSRLVVDKGINETIKAFNEIHLRFPKTKLLIVGDGPERSYFEKIAKNNSSIVFAGYQTKPLDWLAKFDCFIHPTYHEALSLSLLEACMLQKPIIATNVGGNPEIITNLQNGLLIAPKNVNQLVKAMTVMLENRRLAKKMAAQAQQTYFKKFEFSKIVKEKIIPLYYD